jgi:CubicO group peptidase (beta-lactamase class C family)
MKATTFDFKLAKGNVAMPHAQNLDGKTGRADNEINKLIIPVRPAGGAWSTVRDMLKYVQMELDEGKLPGGKQYLAKDILLARRAPQVATGPDSAYGMGLSIGSRYGVTVVSHGGDLIGFHSDMMWLPQYNVGAVVLTNGDGGDMIRSLFKRKLLEVLFDGKPEADAAIASGAKSYFDSIAASRKLLTVPAAPAAAGALAAKYSNAALGTITVLKKDGAVTFDFGEFKSEVATMTNPDGTTTFVTIATGITGIAFVAGGQPGAPTLTLRDAQHEYMFTAL